ncbi:class I tRNA ligase family protein [Shigella flexneri]
MSLEGSDQHRGWLMSSLMIGVAMKSKAPAPGGDSRLTLDGRVARSPESIGNGWTRRT